MKFQKLDLLYIQINLQIFLSSVSLFQISRRGALSGDVRMQSAPRKQLQFYNSSIEDMKLPNNGEHSDNAGKSPFEERQPEKEMTRGKKGNKNCSSTPLFLFLCALVIVVLLLAWCKEDRKELYVVPT